jgi:hypothetical protein
MLLIGIIGVLQGLNIQPGSCVTGQIIWAAYGAPPGPRRRRPRLVGRPGAERAARDRAANRNRLFPARAAVLKPPQAVA